MLDKSGRTHIAAMSDKEIAQVRSIEEVMLTYPQVDLSFDHLIHGGMYARTVSVPANLMMSGALIKTQTILIICGEVEMYTNGGVKVLEGYHVIPASAGRKQVFLTKKETLITMILATQAMTVEDAEKDFTDEHDRLADSQCYRNSNTIITGE